MIMIQINWCTVYVVFLSLCIRKFELHYINEGVSYMQTKFGEKREGCNSLDVHYFFSVFGHDDDSEL